MPYQVKLSAAEQWTLSRTAWTNTGQKIPQMAELTGCNKLAELLEMGTTVCPTTTTTTT